VHAFNISIVTLSQLHAGSRALKTRLCLTSMPTACGVWHMAPQRGPLHGFEVKK
jgi:hypothetical protein